MQPAPETHGHVPSLDGVRGIAILMVLVNNFYLGPATTGLEYTVYHVLRSGWAGVDLFFVLSGFLITGILLDNRDSPSYYRDFYSRRILRIFPIYYLALILWVPLTRALPIYSPADVASLEHAMPWYWTYLQNVHFALQAPPHPGEPTTYWSLATEEQFYLVWPLLVAWLGRGLPRLCLGAIVVAPLLRLAWHLLAPGPLAFEGITGLVPTRMDSLALGGLLAWYLRQATVQSALRARCRQLAWLGAGLVGLQFVWQQGLRSNTVYGQVAGYSVMAIGAAALVLLAVADRPEGLPRRILSHPVLRACGRYSYGTYVFHVIVAHVAGVWPGLNHPPTLLGSRLPAPLLTMLALSLVSLLGGMASYHLIERHFLRLKRYFPSRARVPAVWGPPPGSPR